MSWQDAAREKRDALELVAESDLPLSEDCSRILELLEQADRGGEDAAP